MDKVIKILEDSFKNQFFDKQTKKEIKNILLEKNLKKDDLNFLSTTAFNWVKNSGKVDSFAIEWLEDVQNFINGFRVKNRKETGVCFSPKNECAQKICKFIQKAEQSLLICVFTISDNSISESILKAHQRGVHIKIITDNEKSMDKGSDIYALHKQGIYIKIDMSRHHMHHKFAIRDNKTLLTGSYNWTRSAEIYNQENFIITDEKKLVKKFINEFDKLWQEMTPYQ